MISLIRNKVIEKISKIVFYYFKVKTLIYKYLLNIKSKSPIIVTHTVLKNGDS